MLGTSSASLEQGILGCHRADGEVCSTAETRTVDDTATCAEIIEMRDDLFPR